MKRRVLSYLLCLCLLTGLLPTTALAAEIAPLDFTGSSTPASGEGYSWDSSQKTLTLNGLDLQVPEKTSAGAHFGIKLPDGAVIVLADGSENAVTVGESKYSNYGIQGAGSLTIRGGGSLTVKAGDAGTTSYGISASSVSVESGTLNVTAGKSTGKQKTSIAILATEGDVTISGGRVIATGGDVAGDGAYSYGIATGEDNEYGNIAITGRGTYVCATGGEATGNRVTSSGGITVAAGEGGVLIEEATVDAAGGDATRSWGISGRFAYDYGTGLSGESGGVIIRNARVTAIGGDVSVSENFSYGIQSDGDIVITGSTVDAAGGRVTIGDDYYVDCADNGYAISFGIGIDVYEADIYLTDSRVTAAGGTSDRDSNGIYTTGHLYIADCDDLEATGGTAPNVSRGLAANETITVRASDRLTAEASASQAQSYGIWAQALTIRDCEDFTATSAGGDSWAIGIYLWKSTDDPDGGVLIVNRDSDIRAEAGEAPNSYGIYAAGGVDVNDGPVEAAGHTRGAYWQSIDMDDYQYHLVFTDTAYAGTDKTYVKDEVVQNENTLRGYPYVLITAARLTLELKPADIITYMRGTRGYEGAVGDDDIQWENTSLPTPLFYLNFNVDAEWTEEGAEDVLDWLGLDGVALEQFKVTASGTDGRPRGWELVYAGDDESTHALYYITPTEAGQDPVRVKFVNPDHPDDFVTSDDFIPDEHLHTSYEIYLYTGSVDPGTIAVEMAYEDSSGQPKAFPPVEMDISGAGELTVCYVVDADPDDTTDQPIVPVAEALTGPVAAGQGAVTQESTTSYTLNNTTVPVNPAGVALLFDDIYHYTADGDIPVEEAFQNRVDEALEEPAPDTVRHYETKYLDLVDSYNGNSWIKASGAVTVTWGYPEGTDQNTTFYVLHFADMHRQDTNLETIDIAEWRDVEQMPVTKTEHGVSFPVEPGNFSPFVLVWETRSTPDPDPKPDPTPDPDPIGSLTISKVVTGGTSDREFTFTVTITSSAGNPLGTRFAYTGSKSGSLRSGDTITLGHGDTITIHGIPEGSRYTVTEANQDGYVTTAEGDTGTIRSDRIAEAAFTNRIDPLALNTEDHIAYIIGYPGGDIQPQGNITRAEVATIFFRLLTDEARETYWSQTNGYTDVAGDAWYNNAISTLSSMGILGGYEDGTFRPDNPITRAEFTKIAVSFFAYADGHFSNPFTDVADNAWYTSFVTAAAGLGLIEGYEDNTFRPDASIVRAEACTIVNRTLGRAPDKDHLLPVEEMITWPDNPPSAWYYAQMQEATNSHDYDWLGDIEAWTEKLEERDWEALEKEWSTAYSAPGGEVMG